MAKIYEVKMYITDDEDYYDERKLKGRLDDILSNYFMNFNISSARASKYFKWQPTLAINQEYTTSPDYYRYFEDGSNMNIELNTNSIRIEAYRDHFEKQGGDTEFWMIRNYISHLLDLAEELETKLKNKI